ncbi:hypothetical protein LIER_33242 [Lithospermum erythrorhizon]|uniref:Uncharacterized protein n=1 Tax=Lithospermum erythrorhizon TaxID=34254 RepID=A0AAV3RYC7_LITER
MKMWSQEHDGLIISLLKFNRGVGTNSACDFDIGFKIFFFLNRVEEFEMIVVGHDNLEAVYKWARSYYRVM